MIKLTTDQNIIYCGKKGNFSLVLLDGEMNKYQYQRVYHIRKRVVFFFEFMDGQFYDSLANKWFNQDD